MDRNVLSQRELNRATLARQLLLDRKRPGPTAVIERLVGLQAQWPLAPFVGIWTRTTSFRRKLLERDLVSAKVVKATVMRQTLHLVSRRDYGLLRAALTGASHYHETPEARRLAPHVRKLAATGPVTTAQALAYLRAGSRAHRPERELRLARGACSRTPSAPPRNRALGRPS